MIKDIAPSPQYGISISMNEDAVGYPILKMDNIMNILAEDHEAKYADISEKTFNQFKLNKFDVLFNRVNSEDFVGRTGIYLLDGKHTFASYLVRVTTGKSYTNCYLTIFLNSCYGKTSLQRVKRRAVNMANINACELGNLSIPIPTEKLQKRIESLVTESYRQKQHAEKLYQDSENLLLSELGLLDWKQDAIRFTHGGREFEVENSISESSYFEVLEHSRIDSEYFQPKFKELFRRLSSCNQQKLLPLKSFSQPLKYGTSECLTYVEGGVPFLRIADLDNKRFNVNSVLYISEKQASSITERVSLGDVLISRSGTLGVAVPITSQFDNAVFGSYFIRTRPDSRIIHPEYLAFFINSLAGQMQVEQKNTGGIQTNLTIQAIENLLIPVGTLEWQRQFTDMVESSLNSRKTSYSLLEKAKRAVEVFIEEGEKAALSMLS